MSDVSRPVAGSGQQTEVPLSPFKARMKRLRLAAGYKTLSEAAAAIGCRREAVLMWESPSISTSRVRKSLLATVAAAYRTTPEIINSQVECPDYPPPEPQATEAGSAGAKTNDTAPTERPRRRGRVEPTARELRPVIGLPTLPQFAESPAVPAIIGGSPQFFARLGLDPERAGDGRHCLMPIEGDAMAPRLDDGDIVVVDTHDRRTEGGGLMALDIGGMICCRRVQACVSGALRISTENERYEEIITTPDRAGVSVIGRVRTVWGFRPL